MPFLSFKITKRRKKPRQNRPGWRWWRYKKGKSQPTNIPLPVSFQPGANNGGNEGAPQGNGDGSGNEGSQQPLLNPDESPDGSIHQGNGDSNSDTQQGEGSGNENNNQEAQQSMSGGNQAANNGSGGGNQAANDDIVIIEADRARPGKWDAIKGFLAVRIENFRGRLQRLGEVLAAPRRTPEIPDGFGTL